jgi:hypothetical protein
MRLQHGLVLMALFGITTAVCADEYARWFVESTMRVDYYHTGTKGEERFSLDRVYEEGPWPGSRTQLLDTLNLGEFFVRVTDRATNATIFSRGFSSIFNEWQTTDEAAGGAYRTFEETDTARRTWKNSGTMRSISTR